MDYKTFGDGDRTYVRAQQAWIILSAHVVFRLDDGWGEGKITYGSLGKLMGFDPQTAGRSAIRPVRHIFRFCEANNLPLISALVVLIKNGEPSWDYAVRSGDELRKIQERALEFDWFSIRPPTVATFKNYPLIDDDAA